MLCATIGLAPFDSISSPPQLTSSAVDAPPDPSPTLRSASSVKAVARLWETRPSAKPTPMSSTTVTTEPSSTIRGCGCLYSVFHVKAQVAPRKRLNCCVTVLIELLGICFSCVSRVFSDVWQRMQGMLPLLNTQRCLRAAMVKELSVCFAVFDKTETSCQSLSRSLFPTLLAISGQLSANLPWASGSSAT